MLWYILAALVGVLALSPNWLVLLPGTIVHEGLHWIVGLLTLAGPHNFSVQPENTVYGEVWFSNLNWFNAFPTAVAPLLSLPAIYLLWPWITSSHEPVAAIVISWAVAATIAQSLPSRQDWRICWQHPVGTVLWIAGIFWLTFWQLGVTIALH
jgi:hypothetical protein